MFNPVVNTADDFGVLKIDGVLANSRTEAAGKMWQGLT